MAEREILNINQKMEGKNNKGNSKKKNAQKREHNLLKPNRRRRVELLKLRACACE